MDKKQFFGANKLVFKASSPGRMDVMGGIADYSGSYLLQMPIKEQTTAYLSWRDDNIIRVKSSSASEVGITDEVCILVQEIAEFSQDSSFEKIRKRLLDLPGGDWAIYIIGCFIIVAKEKGLPLQGADVWIDSDVPFGKGVSSSAAIEVAVMIAILSSKNIEVSRTELPILAQKVENEVVGAPCGLMDQIASYLGKQNSLLPIVCQPCEVYSPLEIPKGISFSGIDSGVLHSVGGSSYGNVRIAAFMGYSVISSQMGVSKDDLIEAHKTGNWKALPYGGYLANIPPSIFEEKFKYLLPIQLTGKEFLKLYGSSIDAVTKVDTNTVYNVLACAKHPIYENNRVRLFAALLRDFSTINEERERVERLTLMGELMYQSHASYNDCGLGSTGTNSLVEKVRSKGPSSQLYGAKITGGGSGGTVCILSYGEEGIISSKTVCKDYSKDINIVVKFFEGSSSGGLHSAVEKITF